MRHLDPEIVVIDAGTELDLLDLTGVVVLFGFLLPLVLFVDVASVINDPTDGGLALGATSTRSTPEARAS
jgi:hypothetical protein